VDPIRLQVNVAESDLAAVRVGSPVRVHAAEGGSGTQARVTAVFPSVDPTARTGVVEAMVPNPAGKFRPGQYLTMDVTTGQSRSGVVVPARAVVWQPAATEGVQATSTAPHVWVIREGTPEQTIYTCTMHPEVKQDHPGKCPKCGMDLTPQVAGGKWRAHLVEVSVGVTAPDFTEIRSGVQAGDQVIYDGYQGLTEDSPVAPTKWGPSGPQTLPPPSGEPAPVAKGTLYTCPMHPEVRQDRPGKCPKCGMDLVPVKPAPQKAVVYTCPMHPEVRQDDPGKCPKCGMDLVPPKDGAR
jgi:hypothetical protein